jgi:hypothetical protein
MRLAQQLRGDAVLVIKNLSIDPAVPEETRFKAIDYRAALIKANVIANLESRLAGMEPVGAETPDTRVRSQVIGSGLHKRLQQIKSRLWRPNSSRPPGAAGVWSSWKGRTV